VQPDCDRGKGFANILNIQDNVNYHAFQNGIQKFTSANGVFSDLEPGTYEILAKGKSCFTTDTLIIKDQPNKPQAPQYTLEQPSCGADHGSLLITNVQSTVTYTLTQNGQTRYTAVNGFFASVAPGSYALLSSGDHCTLSDSITLHESPAFPALPQFTIAQPSCLQATASITITNYSGQVLYQLQQNKAILFTAVNGVFDNVEPGSYELVASSQLTGCSASASLAVKQRPYIPTAPQYSLTHPTCTSDKGSVTVTNVEAGLSYLLKQGATAQYAAANGVFPAINPGTYDLVAVAQECTSSSGLEIYPVLVKPEIPKYEVVQPNCQQDFAQLIIENPDSRTEYYLGQNGVIRFTATGNTFDAVESGAYELIAIKGSCSKSDSVKVNKKPFRP
ncbi:MAG: hypothetical protein ACKO6K_00140, partial [Chitinophagaceae bacterium]